MTTELLEKQLAEIAEAEARLSPILKDQELAKQRQAVEEAIKRQEELATLKPLAIQQEASTIELLREATSVVTAYRQRVEACIRELEALPKDLPAAQAGIYRAGKMAIKLAQTKARIAELETGRKGNVLGELEALWTAAGGKSELLLPLPATLAEDLQKRFRGQLRYMPHLGVQNIL